MASLDISPLLIQSHTGPGTVLLHLRCSLLRTFQNTKHVLSRKTGEIVLGPASSLDEFRKLQMGSLSVSRLKQSGKSGHVRGWGTWRHLPFLSGRSRYRQSHFRCQR